MVAEDRAGYSSFYAWSAKHSLEAGHGSSGSHAGLAERKEKADDARRQIAKLDSEDEQTAAAMVASGPTHFAQPSPVCPEDVFQQAAFYVLQGSIINVNLSDGETVFLQMGMDLGAVNNAGDSTFGPVLPVIAPLCSSPPERNSLNSSPRQPESIVAGRNSAPYPTNKCIHHPRYYPAGGSSSTWNGSVTEYPPDKHWIFQDRHQPMECYHCLKFCENVTSWMLGKPAQFPGYSCLLTSKKASEYKRRRVFKKLCWAEGNQVAKNSDEPETFQS